MYTKPQLIYQFWSNEHLYKGNSWKLMLLLTEIESPITPTQLIKKYKEVHGYGVTDNFLTSVLNLGFIKIQNTIHDKYKTEMRLLHFNPQQAKDFIAFCEEQYKIREERGCKPFAMMQEVKRLAVERGFCEPSLQ